MVLDRYGGLQMKARHKILHMPYIEGEEGEYNEVIGAWADPHEDRIYGINYPSNSDEARSEGPNRLLVDLTLLVPKRVVEHTTELDRFALVEAPTEYFEVQGIPRSGEYTPFRWNPGGVILLRRTEG